MKYLVTIAIAVVVVTGGIIFFSTTLHYIEPQDEIPETFNGFSIDRFDGNPQYYSLDNLDEMPCDDFKAVFDHRLLETDRADVLMKKLQDCKIALVDSNEFWEPSYNIKINE